MFKALYIFLCSFAQIDTIGCAARDAHLIVPLPGKSARESQFLLAVDSLFFY